MSIKTFAPIVLLAFPFIFCTKKVNAQDTISIEQKGYELKQAVARFGRTQAFSKPGNTPLQKGIYKNIDNSRHTVFSVNDSGYLQGEKRIRSGTRLQSVSHWNNGRLLREYVYSYDSGRLLEEIFDSTATIFLYDSITNNWNSRLMPVKVRKEFSMVKGAEADWVMVFSGGTTHAYAIFSFRNGKMISRNYLKHFYEQYNSKGELVLKEVYNWKLKQREMTSYTDSTKTIITNKNTSWNKDGTIDYLTVGASGEDMQNTFYKSGKLIKRIIWKNNTKTTIEYDTKGKIKTKRTDKLPKVDNEIESPV